MSLDKFTPTLNRGANLGVQIYYLLADGHPISSVAKKLNCSVSLVWKHANKYVEKGMLERVSKYPAQFRKPQKIYTHVNVVGDLHPVQPPINIPCKFGASFALVGRPTLIYDKQGKAKDIQPTHVAIFGRHKAVIWLKAGFRGETPDEIIKNGNDTLKAIARSYEEKFGISLSYLRTFLDIEWVMVHFNLGKRLSKYEGIKKGEKKEIAGAYHKFGDSSHPSHRQYQAIENKDPVMPTEHASIDHYIYSGQFAKDMSGLHALSRTITQEYSENIREHLAVIKEIKEAIKDLRSEISKLNNHH